MQDEGLKKVIIFSNSWSEKSISSNEETEVVYIASHDLEINHEMVKNLQKELESSENIVFIYSTNILYRLNEFCETAIKVYIYFSFLLTISKPLLYAYLFDL